MRVRYTFCVFHTIYIIKYTIYSGFPVLIGQALENIGNERFPAELSNNCYLCQGLMWRLATVARRRIRILKSQYYVSLADLVFTFNIKHIICGSRVSKQY